MFLIGLPIAYYAAKYGVDIDLLTRGAGFGYMGSTVTSLIYASFTFLLFAIEASILSMALKMLFDIPMWHGAPHQLAGGHSDRDLWHQPHQPDADLDAADLAGAAVRAARLHRVEAPGGGRGVDALHRQAGQRATAPSTSCCSARPRPCCCRCCRRSASRWTTCASCRTATEQNRVGWWTALIGTGPGLGAARRLQAAGRLVPRRAGAPPRRARQRRPTSPPRCISSPSARPCSRRRWRWCSSACSSSSARSRST